MEAQSDPIADPKSEGGLTLEELKDAMRRDLRESGLEGKLRAGFRTKLIERIHAGTKSNFPTPSRFSANTTYTEDGVASSSSDESTQSMEGSPTQSRHSRVVPARTMQERVMDSMVAEYLKQRNLPYSLSVFLPESMTETDLLNPSDVLYTLRINDFDKNIVSKVSLLEQLITSVSKAESSTQTTECATQTNDTESVSPGLALEKKLAAIHDEYLAACSVHKNSSPLTLEDQMLKYQQDCDKQVESEIKQRVDQIRNIEIAQVRAEEKVKYKQELEKARNELRREYKTKLERVSRREEEIVRDHERQQAQLESERYEFRQQTLHKLNQLQRQKDELDREKRLWEKEKKVEEDRLKDLRSKLDYEQQKLNNEKNGVDSLLQRERSELQRSLEEAFQQREQFIQSEEKRLKQMQAQVLESRTTLLNEQQRLASLDKRCESAITKEKHAQDDIIKLSSELEKQRAQLELTVQLLKRETELNSELKLNTSRDSTELIQSNQTLARKVEELQNELDTLRLLNKANQEVTKDASKDQYRELQSENLRLKAQLADSEIVRKEIEHEAKQLKKLLAETRERFVAAIGNGISSQGLELTDMEADGTAHFNNSTAAAAAFMLQANFPLFQHAQFRSDPTTGNQFSQNPPNVPFFQNSNGDTFVEATHPNSSNAGFSTYNMSPIDSFTTPAQRPKSDRSLKVESNVNRQQVESSIPSELEFEDQQVVESPQRSTPSFHSHTVLHTPATSSIKSNSTKVTPRSQSPTRTPSPRPTTSSTIPETPPSLSIPDNTSQNDDKASLEMINKNEDSDSKLQDSVSPVGSQRDLHQVPSTSDLSSTLSRKTASNECDVDVEDHNQEEVKVAPQAEQQMGLSPKPNRKVELSSNEDPKQQAELSPNEDPKQQVELSPKEDVIPKELNVSPQVESTISPDETHSQSPSSLHSESHQASNARMTDQFSPTEPAINLSSPTQQSAKGAEDTLSIASLNAVIEQDVPSVDAVEDESEILRRLEEQQRRDENVRKAKLVKMRQTAQLSVDIENSTQSSRQPSSPTLSFSSHEASPKPASPFKSKTPTPDSADNKGNDETQVKETSPKETEDDNIIATYLDNARKKLLRERAAAAATSAVNDGESSPGYSSGFQDESEESLEAPDVKATNNESFEAVEEYTFDNSEEDMSVASEANSDGSFF